MAESSFAQKAFNVSAAHAGIALGLAVFAPGAFEALHMGAKVAGAHIASAIGVGGAGAFIDPTSAVG